MALGRRHIRLDLDIGNGSIRRQRLGDETVQEAGGNRNEGGEVGTGERGEAGGLLLANDIAEVSHE